VFPVAILGSPDFDVPSPDTASPPEGRCSRHGHQQMILPNLPPQKSHDRWSFDAALALPAKQASQKRNLAIDKTKASP
jgi:hypothetical protein